MAGFALPPGFGASSWGESSWAAAMGAVLSRFRVADDAAWKPSVVTGLDRTVQIATGAGWGCGVWDETDAAETVQLDPNTGTTNRFDVIVARWVWSTKTREFAVIKGTSTPPAVNTGTIVDTNKINRIKGRRYEGVIAVVRVRPNVGTFAGTDLTDLRVWGPIPGALRAASATYPGLLDLSTAGGGAVEAGSGFYVGSVRWEYNGTAWLPYTQRIPWVPRFTSASGGDLSFGSGATISAWYKILGTEIDYDIAITCGSGVNGGIGDITLIMPTGTINLAGAQRYGGDGDVGVYNVGDYPLSLRPQPGSARVRILSIKLGPNFDPTKAPFKNADAAGGQGQGIPQVAGQPLVQGSSIWLDGRHEISGYPALT